MLCGTEKKDNYIGIVPQYAQSGCVRAHSNSCWKAKEQVFCVCGREKQVFLCVRTDFLKAIYSAAEEALLLTT